MAKQSKVKKIVTEKIRKKYGACEHDSVSFKALEKLCDKQQSYCRTRDRIIDRLTREIDRKGALIDDWTQSRGRWINDVNQSLLKKDQDKCLDKTLFYSLFVICLGILGYYFLA